MLPQKTACRRDAKSAFLRRGNVLGLIPPRLVVGIGLPSRNGNNEVFNLAFQGVGRLILADNAVRIVADFERF